MRARTARCTTPCGLYASAPSPVLRTSGTTPKRSTQGIPSCPCKRPHSLTNPGILQRTHPGSDSIGSSRSPACTNMGYIKFATLNVVSLIRPRMASLFLLRRGRMGSFIISVSGNRSETQTGFLPSGGDSTIFCTHTPAGTVHVHLRIICNEYMLKACFVTKRSVEYLCVCVPLSSKALGMQSTPSQRKQLSASVSCGAEWSRHKTKKKRK